MQKIIVNTIILAAIFLLSGCGIFWVRKHDPKAKFCYFETSTRTIYCSPPGGGGIAKIDVFLYSENFSLFILKNITYSDKPNKIELAKELEKIDPNLLKKHELHIQILNNSPVIFDYGIVIKPEDWKKKIVYGWWNAR